MELDREYFLRLIKGRSAGAVVVEGSGESGGGGGGATLGPLLTSLNAEAMPVSEGYLHWTGSAWAFDTPTGGDPVDLTPYAQKTWVQSNFASLNDISGLLSKSEADGYYAPISFVKPYLPLVAGSSNPLTGSLYITGNSGITWVGGYGMLCFKPTSGWAGVNENQWGVGSHGAQGVIRSSLELKRYDGTYEYTIYDSSNLDPLNYIRKDGGTVTGTLNVKSYLNIQSAAGTNKISFDGTTPNIDIASGGQLTFDVDSHIAHDSTNDRLVIHGNNGILIDSDTYVGSVASGNEVATKGYVTGQGYLKGVSVYGSALTPDANRVVNIPYAATNVPGVIKIGEGLRIEQGGDHLEVDTTAIATRSWADGRYLPLSGGRLDGSLYMKSMLSTDNYPARTGHAIGMFAQLNQHATQGDDGNRGGLFFMYGRESGVAQDKLNSIIINCLSEYKSDWYSGDYGLMITSDDIKFKGTSLAKVSDLSSYLPLTGGTVNGNLNVKGTIQAQDSNGNNKVIIYGTTGNIRAEKVYIGGSTSGYEAATHNWVTGQGYQANVIESVKVNGTALTPTNKSVDIPAATSDGSTFGVVAIGTGFTFDEDRLCVDTSTFATHAWADGRYLKLTGGTMTGNLIMNGNGIALVPNQGYPNIYYQNGQIVILGPAVHVQTDGEFFFNGDQVATQPWVTTQLGSYLPLSAGSSHPLTGNIAYKGTKATYDMITFIDNVGDIYGNGIAIGGGGATIIGGGESAGTMSAQVSGGSEVMYIGNDGSVSIFTNLQSGWANRKEFTFYNTGVLSTAGSVVTPNGSGLYIKDTGGTECMAVFVNSSNQFFVGYGMRNAGYTGYFDSNVMHLRSGASGTTMTLDANNRVGIGTTTPGYKLDVNGNTGVTGSLDVSIELNVGDVTNGGVWLSDSALGVWTMSGTTRQDTELMSLASGGVTLRGDMIITGKMAVNTTSFDGTNAKLQVAGNITASGSITSKSSVGNVVIANNAVTAATFYANTVIFGSSNNDAALYVSNGHVWARNSSGTSTMIV